MKETEPPEPGTVWWCDGPALSFEAHFKRRPVLVLGVREKEGENGTIVCEVIVAPLSSKRRYGQEQAVTHRGGISYLTGRIAAVPPDALLSSLGVWEGFAKWSSAQNARSAPCTNVLTLWFRAFIAKWRQP